MNYLLQAVEKYIELNEIFQRTHVVTVEKNCSNCLDISPFWRRIKRRLITPALARLSV